MLVNPFRFRCGVGEVLGGGRARARGIAGSREVACTYHVK